MSYRYWSIKDDPEGRRFCYSTVRFMTCPMANIDPDRAQGDIASSWPNGIEEAAAAMRMMPHLLAELMESAHRRYRGQMRMERNGRVTNDCATCGHRLTDHGFSAWIEKDRDDDGFEKAIAERVGLAPPAVRLKHVKNLTRKDAKQWAYDEYQTAKSVLKEATTSG